ncbi:MAG: HAD family hydrolase, partial [Eubacteriales bacterium]
ATDAGGLICKELGLEPSEILYFGDGDTDMEFGSKSGFYTVGCTWGYRPAEVLKECGAHKLVDTAEELLEILGL